MLKKRNDYSPEKFKAIMEQEIARLVNEQIAEFEDKVVPTAEEIERAAEVVTMYLYKLTEVPIKKLISRFLWLYYCDIKNKQN